MKRVLAVAVACLLMAGALLTRNAITGDDDDEGDGNGGETGGDLVVACIPELAEACRALDRDIAELRIEDPEDTIAAPDVDAWVTLDPWPAMAALPAFEDVVAVAQSDLVLLARESEVPGTCEAPVTWTCLVDALGDKVALDASSATGLLLLGQAGQDFLPGYAGNEVRGDRGLRDFLGSIDRALRDPVGDMLVLPDPDASGTTSADVEARVDPSAVSGNLVRSPSAAPATVAVVVTGPDAARVAGEPAFTEALGELGWQLSSDAATTGLPNAGVLVALAQEFG